MCANSSSIHYVLQAQTWACVSVAISFSPSEHAGHYRVRTYMTLRYVAHSI